MIPAAAAMRRLLAMVVFGALLAFAAILASVMTGPAAISNADVMRVLLAWTGMTAPAPEEAVKIVLSIRLPRALMAALAGGGLSVAGVIFQVLLRNALAEPYILGVSGGAAAGALTAMVTGFGAMFAGAIPLFAFIGASAVVAAVYAVGRKRKPGGDDTLLLTGVMAGAFAGAVILAMISVMGDTARSALFWLLGYLGHATEAEVAMTAPVMLLISAYFIFRAKAFNVLSLGEEQAQHLGLNVRRMMFSSYMLSSMLTAVIVSFSGAIGFVGLIVPHVVRLLTGPDHRTLIPVSLLAGAFFLVCCDMLARTLFAPAELPVGAVTAAIGAPLFVFLLVRNR